MGEVWLARDVGLGRKLALKLLPPDFSNDARRVTRFEQEARAASALSHPNICHVYALGRTPEGQRYIAMELVEGATLRNRLQAARLPIAEALKICSQIAAAVSAAHAAGIVHRDLKPENVIVRADGLVKVLDFGLAKVSPLNDGAVAGDESTQTVLRTDAGTVVGTVAYMSPEQARGQTLDARTDIWSLGVVLYEAVTGRRPFAGGASTEVLAAILEHDVEPLSRADPQAPEELQRIVGKALKKERSQRYQTMSDLSLDLEALRDELHVKSRSGSGPVTAVSPAGRWTRGRAWAAVLAVVVVLATGAWAVFRGSHPPQSGPDRPVLRKVTRLTFEGRAGFGALSPDGQRFVFGMERAGQPSLWVQPTGGGNMVPITKSPDELPDWSPDGKYIAFEREREGILVVSQLGGEERRISTFGGWPRWSPDGSQILFSIDGFGPNIRVFVAAPDHAPRQILSSFLQGGHWQPPLWHPDGRVTITGTHRTEGFGIFTISTEGGRSVKTTIPHELLKESNIPEEEVWPWCWSPSAQFVYATATAGGVMNIWRLQVDSQLRVTAIDRLTNGGGADWAAGISRDGRKLQFSTITGNSRLWSFPIDKKTGNAGGPRQPLSEEDGEVNWTALSRDGRNLAYFYAPLNASSLRQSELRLLSFPFTGARETIPADQYVRMASAWAHKGDRLAIQAAELSSTGSPIGNVLIIRERGTEHVVARCQTRLANAPCGIVPVDWAPDDSAVLASSRIGEEKMARLGLWPASVTVPLEAPRDTLVDDPEWNLSQATYSPDGRWVAFAYGRGFGEEKGIAVIPASGRVPKTSWRSIADGFEALGNPRWASDGLSLYFTAADNGGFPSLWRVGIVPTTGLQANQPAKVTVSDGGEFYALARSYYPTIALGPDRILLPMNSQHADMWMIDNVDR